jgi:ribosomal protein S18 acetylase RimI-like enzyme
MGKITFQVVHAEDYRELATWLVTMSEAPERQCLHTWSGESPEGLQERLLGYHFDCELLYYMALRNGNLVGAMGSEYDEELMRAWLHGPHAVEEGWEKIAGELYTRLCDHMRPGIKQWDAFLNVEYTRGRRFYSERGFDEMAHLNYEFWLEPERRVISGERGAELLREDQRVSFKRLYGAHFPGGYYSADRIIGMTGRSHQVLVIADGHDVLGYAVVSAEGGAGGLGELQFLGVREDCRGKGHGRRLLLTAVDWLLDGIGVSRISLNVNEELVGARSLYESVGFRLRFTGIGLRSLRRRVSR